LDARAQRPGQDRRGARLETSTPAECAEPYSFADELGTAEQTGTAAAGRNDIGAGIGSGAQNGTEVAEPAWPASATGRVGTEAGERRRVEPARNVPEAKTNAGREPRPRAGTETRPRQQRSPPGPTSSPCSPRSSSFPSLAKSRNLPVSPHCRWCWIWTPTGPAVERCCPAFADHARRQLLPEDWEADSSRRRPGRFHRRQAA